MPAHPSVNQLIFLIGYSGVGKTYWGKLWSERSWFSFFDLDEIIETENKKTISEIFAEYGEAHFRELETVALRKFENKNKVIVACGGGTPCFNNNIKWMNENATTVYLKASPENILKRLEGEKEKRPLIRDQKKEDLLFYVTQKISERELYYNQAKIILHVDQLERNYLPDFLNIDHA